MWGKHKEKIADRLIKIYERASRAASGYTQTFEEVISEKFADKYNWRIDHLRLKLVCNLDEYSLNRFLFKFKVVWSEEGMSAPKTFDRAMRELTTNRFIGEDIKLQIETFLLDLSKPQENQMAFFR